MTTEAVSARGSHLAITVMKVIRGAIRRCESITPPPWRRGAAGGAHPARSSQEQRRFERKRGVLGVPAADCAMRPRRTRRRLEGE
eukprot:1080132-Prymnesium_polylepis.2